MPLQFHISSKHTTTYPFDVFLRICGPKYSRLLPPLTPLSSPSCLLLHGPGRSAPRQAMWGPPPASAAPRPWAYAPRRPTAAAATAMRRRRLLGAWGGARGGSPAGHQLLLPFLPQSTSSDGHCRRPDRAHASPPPPFHPTLDDAAGVEVGKVRVPP